MEKISVENLNKCLDENGKLTICRTTIWKTCDIPITDSDEHAQIALEFLNLQDKGIVKVEDFKEPRFYFSARGMQGKEYEDFLFSVFDNSVSVSKRIRTFC